MQQQRDATFPRGHKSQATTLIPTDKSKSKQWTFIVTQIYKNKQHSHEFSIYPAACTPVRTKLIHFGIKRSEVSSKNCA